MILPGCVYLFVLFLCVVGVSEGGGRYHDDEENTIRLMFLVHAGYMHVYVCICRGLC